jgi:hypothetical protein
MAAKEPLARADERANPTYTRASFWYYTCPYKGDHIHFVAIYYNDNEFIDSFGGYTAVRIKEFAAASYPTLKKMVNDFIKQSEVGTEILETPPSLKHLAILIKKSDEHRACHFWGYKIPNGYQEVAFKESYFEGSLFCWLYSEADRLGVDASDSCRIPAAM